MFRFLLRRLVNLPIILFISNFVGFAFAFSVAPIVSSSNPYSHAETDLPPLLPAYWDYLKEIIRGNFGKTFNGEPVLETISRVGLASLGLIAISSRSASCSASGSDDWPCDATAPVRPRG